jgi:hypothetical protein
MIDIPRASAEAYLAEMMDRPFVEELLRPFGQRWSARAFAHPKRPCDLTLDLTVGAGNGASDVDDEWLTVIRSQGSLIEFVNVWGELRRDNATPSSYLGCPSRVVESHGMLEEIREAILNSPLFYVVLVRNNHDHSDDQPYIHSVSMPCYDGEGWLMICAS